MRMTNKEAKEAMKSCFANFTRIIERSKKMGDDDEASKFSQQYYGAMMLATYLGISDDLIQQARDEVREESK